MSHLTPLELCLTPPEHRRRKEFDLSFSLNDSLCLLNIDFAIVTYRTWISA